MGTSMFLYRGALTLYTGGNALILGLFVPPQFVGYYAAAEKISRASYRLLNPVTQALYPRMSYLVEHAREKAQRLARIGVIVVGAGGLGLTLLIFRYAPWLVRTIVGPEFGPAVPLLRILAIVPALVAFWQSYGTQWMLPLGLDRAFNSVVLLAGAVNVVLALILVPHYADFGMAWTAVVSEAVIAVGFYLMLRWYKLDPFQPSVETAGVVR
jgi:PST family polysaccharide transporter